MFMRITSLHSFFLCCSVLPCGQIRAEEGIRPNLLVVMADQFRGDAFGFREREMVKTPAFDAFAQKAVVLNQAVSGYPVSSPARGMFLSGAYPHRNGVLTNCQSQSAPQDVELREDLTCWSDVAVAWNEWCPPHRRHGFDYWVSYGTYDYHLRPMYWNTDGGRQDFYYVDKWGPEYEADLAIDYIDSVAHSEKPFALMVSMNPPHTGYELVPEKYKRYKHLNVDSIVQTMPQLRDADPKFVEYFKRSLPDYYACIAGVDEQFGRIMASLTKNGLLENTIVVFVSDHGDCMGMHENIGKNIFYEEAMRIPFMVSWKGHLIPRMDNDLLISLEDFCPSILSLMGLKEKIPATVQTRDLSEQIRGSRKKMPREQLYMLYSEVNKKGKHLTTGARGLRDARYTYAVRFKNGVITERHLYDRKNDPAQMENLAEKQSKRAQKMHRRLKELLVEKQDPAAGVL